MSHWSAGELPQVEKGRSEQELHDHEIDEAFLRMISSFVILRSDQKMLQVLADLRLSLSEGSKPKTLLDVGTYIAQTFPIGPSGGQACFSRLAASAHIVN